MGTIRKQAHHYYRDKLTDNIFVHNIKKYRLDAPGSPSRDSNRVQTPHLLQVTRLIRWAEPATRVTQTQQTRLIKNLRSLNSNNSNEAWETSRHLLIKVILIDFESWLLTGKSGKLGIENLLLFLRYRRL